MCYWFTAGPSVVWLCHSSSTRALPAEAEGVPFFAVVGNAGTRVFARVSAALGELGQSPVGTAADAESRHWLVVPAPTPVRALCVSASSFPIGFSACNFPSVCSSFSSHFHAFKLHLAKGVAL